MMKSTAGVLKDGARHQTLGHGVAQMQIHHGNEQREFLISKLPIPNFDSRRGLFFKNHSIYIC